MDDRQPFGGTTNTLMNSRKPQSQDHPDNQAVENGKFVDHVILL